MLHLDGTILIIFVRQKEGTVLEHDDSIRWSISFRLSCFLCLLFFLLFFLLVLVILFGLPLVVLVATGEVSPAEERTDCLEGLEFFLFLCSRFFCFFHPFFLCHNRRPPPLTEHAMLHAIFFVQISYSNDLRCLSIPTHLRLLGLRSNLT